MDNFWRLTINNHRYKPRYIIHNRMYIIWSYKLLHQNDKTIKEYLGLVNNAKHNIMYNKRTNIIFYGYDFSEDLINA